MYKNEIIGRQISNAIKDRADQEGWTFIEIIERCNGVDVYLAARVYVETENYAGGSDQYGAYEHCSECYISDIQDVDFTLFKPDTDEELPEDFINDVWKEVERFLFQ